MLRQSFDGPVVTAFMRSKRKADPMNRVTTNHPTSHAKIDESPGRREASAAAGLPGIVAACGGAGQRSHGLFAVGAGAPLQREVVAALAGPTAGWPTAAARASMARDAIRLTPGNVAEVAVA